MTGFPHAKSDGLVAMEIAGTLVIQDMTGCEIARLNGDAARVWQLADGATPVDGIARALNAGCEMQRDNEFVWSVLDSLADLGLLQQRVTPPAGEHLRSRRGMLRDVVAGGGIIGMAMAAAPAVAIAAEASIEQKSKHSRSSQEGNEKKSYMSTEQVNKKNHANSQPDFKRQQMQEQEGKTKMQGQEGEQKSKQYHNR